MKKYFFGLAAVIAAIGLNAFTTKPTFTQTFFFDNASFSYTEINVEDPDKWEAGAVSCATGNRSACVIQSVDPKYYHIDGGDLILNSANRPSSEQNDVEFSITATEGSVAGVYVVDPINTDGIIVNKQ